MEALLARPSHQPSPPELGRAIAASTVGNVLEWFDFAVYGYMAPYLGPLFFPSRDPVASTIAAFAVFAVGYLARPLGALFLGRLGDRVGRRTLLVLSIAILGGSSCAIGLLPTHDRVGDFAAVLLVLMRLAQGFSVGGEYTGSVAYSTEMAPQARRGLIASLATTGTMMGILLSSGAVWLVRTLVGPEALAAWGWRVPFLLGSVIMVFGVLLRRKIPETQHEEGRVRASTPARWCDAEGVDRHLPHLTSRRWACTLIVTLRLIIRSAP